MSYTAAFKAFLNRANLDVKPHQIDGFEWIMRREKANSPSVKGGFLCDEMGLGKTILLLGAIMVNREASQNRTLIVCRFRCFSSGRGYSKISRSHTHIYHGAGGKSIDERLGERR